MSDTDIVERLTARAKTFEDGSELPITRELLREAADRIEALSSALDRVTRERDARDREILSLRNAAVNLLDRAEAAEARLTQAVTREREECAKVAARYLDRWAEPPDTAAHAVRRFTADDVAAAIRARSHTEGESK